MPRTADEIRGEIGALQRELAEAEDRPLTISEIREMTPDEVEEHWARVQPTLARITESEEPVTPLERLRRGFAQAADPAEVRASRRNLTNREEHDGGQD